MADFDTTRAGRLPPPVHDHDIHIWQLDLGNARWERCAHVLAPRELTLCQRISAVDARQERMRSRIALRVLLGRYLGSAPAAVVLQDNHYGKPELADGALHFNVSHSGARALVAVARQAIGIDLERGGPRRFPVEKLLQAIMHERERAMLSGAPASLEDFYRLWVRKEAYCKAAGSGVYRDMSTFAVLPAEDGNGYRVLDDASTDRRAYLHDLDTGNDGYAAYCTFRPAHVVLQGWLEPGGATAAALPQPEFILTE